MNEITPPPVPAPEPPPAVIATPRIETPPEAIEPARLPATFWARLDYLLHHPRETIESLRRNEGTGELARVAFFISLAMSALYGMVMGATNLLQGTPLPFTDKLFYILGSTIKVPVLYLVSLAIVLPPIYVSNAFVGSRLAVRQMAAAMLCSLAVTVTVLASMATVAAFFSLTSRSYHFIKTLHVAFFAYAGLMGFSFLSRCNRALLPPAAGAAQRRLLAMGLVLYMFVGTQMAWVLRPYIGSPGNTFEMFRDRSGNFYESVFESIKGMFKFD
jgi:hypothetical protein